MADNLDMAGSTAFPAVSFDEGRVDGGSDSGDSGKMVQSNVRDGFCFSG